ncbi:putative inorganic phosphate cotransporter [Bactrocera dorsalis]|uniref:Inorganic phosphate cotransporter n=1 Tax=Bactrocera dorsalis TaxID=27457 RepID=A0ABM3JI60_BACDO|nr:putative inorganic phosphate cotransporter [Bactrocera dorsalis]
MATKSFDLIQNGFIIPARYIQVLLMFTAILLVFYQRVNLSVAIVVLNKLNGTTNTTQPQFDYASLTPHQRSSMLGSVFWGTFSVQLLSGYLSSHYGTVKLLLCCVLGSSLISLCLPYVLIYCGYEAFIAFRVLQGCTQGIVFPAVYGHLAKWCPLKERSLLGGVSQSGLDMGMALGFLCSGLLAVTSLGWMAIFYVPGVAGVIWSALWLAFAAESPQKCRYISHKERTLIDEVGVAATSTKRNAPTPWCAILTSVPYLVLVLVKLSHGLSIFTLMQQIPLYINGLYDYEIHVNAMLSSLPFFLMFVTSHLVSYTAHYLLVVRKCPLALVRKSMNTLSTWVPAAAFVAMTLLSEEHVSANIACLIVAVTTYAAAAVGSSLNHIDLSPNFGGMLVGMTNMVMTGMGVISPIAVAEIVKDENDRSQWNIIFLIIAALLFLGNLLYLIFGQMVAQPWDKIENMDNRAANNTVVSFQVDTIRNIEK